jgi:DNA-binding transcriptional ArsR family regulator
MPGVAARSAGDALTALGHGTRRSILDALRDGPLPVKEIAECVPVSRPAVSQHLRTLVAAGLLYTIRHGNRRLYALDSSGISAAATWIDSLNEAALRVMARSEK